MKRYFLFLFILLFYLGCTNQLKFEREVQIKAYLSKEHGYQMPKNNDVYLIFFSGQCGSCNMRSVQVALELSSRNHSEVKTVLHQDFLKQREFLDSLGIDTFYDVEGKLPRYGLNFEKNLILYYKNQTLKYWNWLYMDQIFAVRERFDLREEGDI